ncbi:hypothetical protein TNCV_2540691, partial [Trichonephila clavipes]
MAAFVLNAMPGMPLPGGRYRSGWYSSTPGVMVWGDDIMTTNLLLIECNLNSNRYVREVLQRPKSFQAFKASLELSFSRI